MNLEISQLVITIFVLLLFFWRVAYGAKNGLFAEATGLISVIAAFAAVFYLMSITGSVLFKNFGNVLPKIGYLLIAFIIYRIMSALGKALRGVREVPLLGTLDRIMGIVLGAVEAIVIIFLVEFVTGIMIVFPVISLGKQLWMSIQQLI